LSAILVAGLWPFHSPKNRVTWLADENGLRIDYPGTLLSANEFPTAGASDSSCSIEVWVQPGRSQDSNTLSAFAPAQNPLQLALMQSDTHLEVRRDVARDGQQRRAEILYADSTFQALRPHLIAITSGAQGFAIYADGKLVRSSRRLRIAARDCTGRTCRSSDAISEL